MRFYSLIALFGIIQALSAVISSPLEPRQTVSYSVVIFVCIMEKLKYGIRAMQLTDLYISPGKVYPTGSRFTLVRPSFIVIGVAF